MNLEKLKTLEDLKILQAQLSKDITTSIRAEKSRALNKAKADFSSFFIPKGFQIIDHGTGLTANYGQQNVTISIPPVETSFLGAYSVIDLILTGRVRKNYTIVLNELGSKSGISSRVRLLPNNEEERLDLEIEDAKEEVEDLKKRKDNISRFKLGFRVFDKDEAQRNPYVKTADTKQFSDISELLASIFA